MTASISVAMIVRNEAGRLSECLGSLRDLADEFCVVDTGSEDDTFEVALHFGARVERFEWVDDFSVARNASLRLCSGGWILAMDADERIAAEDIDKVRAYARGPADIAYRFVTRNYTNRPDVTEFKRCDSADPHARGFLGWYPSAKVRMFPNVDGARFEGPVHELVNPSLERLGLRFVDSEVPIHHYGMARTEQELRRRQALYIRLGLAKTRAYPEDPKAFAELGNQYVEAGDYANAAAAYREALKRAPDDGGLLSDLGGALFALGRVEEARRALELAVGRAPMNAAAQRNLGVLYARNGQWDAAARAFEHALRLDPAWDDGYRYLSVALDGLGRVDAAAEASRKALEANPRSAEALRLFVDQKLRLQRRDDAQAFVEKLVREGVANAGLNAALHLLSAS